MQKVVDSHSHNDASRTISSTSSPRSPRSHSGQYDPGYCTYFIGLQSQSMFTFRYLFTLGEQSKNQSTASFIASLFKYRYKKRPESKTTASCYSKQMRSISYRVHDVLTGGMMQQDKRKHTQHTHKPEPNHRLRSHCCRSTTWPAFPRPFPWALSPDSISKTPRWRRGRQIDSAIRP